MDEKVCSIIESQIKNRALEIIFQQLISATRDSVNTPIKFYLQTREDGLRFERLTLESLAEDWVIELAKLATGIIYDTEKGEIKEEDYFGWDESLGDYFGFEGWRGLYCRIKVGESGDDWFSERLNMDDDPRFSTTSIQRKRMEELLRNHQTKRGSWKSLVFPDDIVSLGSFSTEEVATTDWLRMLLLFEREEQITLESLKLYEEGVRLQAHHVLSCIVTHKEDFTSMNTNRVSLPEWIYYLRQEKEFRIRGNKELSYPIGAKPKYVNLMEWLIEQGRISCPTSRLVPLVMTEELEMANRELQGRIGPNWQAKADSLYEQKLKHIEAKMGKDVIKNLHANVKNALKLEKTIKFITQQASSIRLEIME